ncbi:MAG: tetrathionate reductase family octaheme c-type cytochrome [Candidatus Thiodiazotropha endolucinida]|nr:tetrathionate reductase family octaheme c-type cytochrome [Candidatus Thiodiazotropha endolucinida]
MYSQQNRYNRLLVRTTAILLLLGLALAFSVRVNATPTPGSTADHSKFEQLQTKFKTGPEVTRACLACHTNAAKQIHKSKHWRWEYDNPATGQKLGKKHVLNNFCIAAGPNIAACTACHISYGWKDDSFDFSSEEAVDCLVCHDTTGLYSREKLRNPGKRRPKLEKFAQNVGPTSRRNCGSCHFAGGGAKAVKHGDIDPTLAAPDYFVDVHMDAEGLNFSCSTCHRSDQHELAGSRYAPNAADNQKISVPGREEKSRVSCRACHDPRPHRRDEKLNDHTDRIACQTCHIPRYSRGDYGSKLWWDWSQAGKMNQEGKPFGTEDAFGFEIYNSKKGDFTWEMHTRPEYRWFNGDVLYTLVEDTIDPGAIVPINKLLGDADSPGTRIWPVKVMRGKQPYDAEYKTLVAPLTTTEEGYWKTFNWDQSIKLGMQAINRPYSGSYDFVSTEMLWPITHMVAPSEEALRCTECHSENGLLGNVEGLYIPGQHSHPWMDKIAMIILLMTLAGVLLHGSARFLLRPKDKQTTDHPQKKIYIFKRFERFWHWAQTLLILFMLITGFEIHGSYTLFGMEQAMNLHTLAAWILIGLWVFAIFWHFTTGEWRQYIPTTNKVLAVARYYSVDIFKNQPHPFRATKLHKHNPLQRLAYLLFKLVLAPAVWISGLLYLFYNDWSQWGLGGLELGLIAFMHTLAAYLLAVFFIGHVYLTTTGHTVTAHIKAMLTGWEEIEAEPAQKQERGSVND